MTDLADLIAALKAGDTDTVLAGTKWDVHAAAKKNGWENAAYDISDMYSNEGPELAARVIVLEAALRSVTEAVTKFNHDHAVACASTLQLGYPRDIIEAARKKRDKALDAIMEATTATADLLEGGE